jgi:hypothetical protein
VPRLRPKRNASSSDVDKTTYHPAPPLLQPTKAAEVPTKFPDYAAQPAASPARSKLTADQVEALDANFKTAMQGTHIDVKQSLFTRMATGSTKRVLRKKIADPGNFEDIRDALIRCARTEIDNGTTDLEYEVDHQCRFPVI